VQKRDPVTKLGAVMMNHYENTQFTVNVYNSHYT
jgi:hypothetical protein